MSNQSSLTVVGTGIKFVSHLTVEAKTYISSADVVLYLVNDPAMEEWIKKNNKNAKSLAKLYFSYSLRKDSYEAITTYILNALKKNKNVCVALYGHPTIFAEPALEATKKAKILGYSTHILPGISSEACLFADLLINPGSVGYQSYEATDFLIKPKLFDTSCHLILWQVGTIGIISHPKDYINKKGIILLTQKLLEYYSGLHAITLYEAAIYPGFSPIIQNITLKDLPSASLNSVTTLYIPPGTQIKHDAVMLNLLDLG